MTIDIKTIAKLAEILDKTNLSELEFEDEGTRICLSRQSLIAGAPMPMQSMASMPAPVAAPIAAPKPEAPVENLASNPNTLKSPIVGVVYLASEPGATPYVKIGSDVKEGDTVCLIEAMKTFNPVKAHKSGKVTQILVTPGSPTEYGEPLMVIE